jgi:predicted sulfurtransferase
MTTEALFAEDSYLKECTARVLAVEEIVTLGAAARGERAQGAARHAPPAEFHALLTGAAASAQGSVLIDCRNAFESDIGTLVPAQGSNLALLRPAVRRFEDMVAWTEAHAEELPVEEVEAVLAGGAWPPATDSAPYLQV